MTDGTDIGDKMIITLARGMYIMIRVEDVMTYTARKGNVCVCAKLCVCVCVYVQKGIRERVGNTHP